MTLPHVVIHLLKGVLYQEDDLPMWTYLLGHRAAVCDAIDVLGLELVCDEAEGYAFLRTRTNSELPRLVSRRQLTYSVSLLLALLRRKLAEADASGGAPRLILSRQEIDEMLRLFLPEGTNEARRLDKLDADLNKIADLGFLRRLKDDVWEVRRILKAFVDAQWLSDLNELLESYRAC